MRLAMLSLLLLAGCAAHRVDPVATRDARITDPDYVPNYRTIAAEELADGNYRKAWSEYAALGDFSSLRKVLLAYIDDVKAFDVRIYDSMIDEYGEAYRTQFNDDRPLFHLREPLTEASEKHAKSGDARRQWIAFEVRFMYLTRLRKIPDRKSYLGTVKALRKGAGGDLAADMDARIGRFEADHKGGL